MLNNELHIVRGRLTMYMSQESDSRSPEANKERVKSRKQKVAKNVYWYHDYGGTSTSTTLFLISLPKKQNTFVPVPLKR